MTYFHSQLFLQDISEIKWSTNEDFEVCWVSMEKLSSAHSWLSSPLVLTPPIIPNPPTPANTVLCEAPAGSGELKKHWCKESIAWVFAREAWNTIRRTLLTSVVFAAGTVKTAGDQLQYQNRGCGCGLLTPPPSPLHKLKSILRSCGPLCPGSWIYTRIHGPGRPDPFDRQGTE